MQDNILIYSIGFLAQLFFSGRLIIQWIVSEKNKTVITPSLFWVMSLLASCLLFLYGYLRNDFAIMLGQSLTYFIYIRNLQLQNLWQKMHVVFRGFFFLLPVALVAFYFKNNNIDINDFIKNDEIPMWLLSFGIVSQIAFTFRFIYQWIYSEKHKESTLPLGFWLLSNFGSILILTYAILRKDPVLFLAHSMGIIIYTRNIILLKHANN